jgi:phytol kinase
MPINEFIYKAVPSADLVLWLLPASIIYTIISAAIVGYLKKEKQVRTPYTRKIFHLLIFTLAGILQIFVGLPAVVIFGTVVSLAVLFAVFKGSGFAFYEAMARPSDAPKRSLFILIPLLTTALGGISSNILFPGFASIGYFVGGFGDAVGEPVGTRWGKHRYNVPSLAGVRAQRSAEGSLAVFIMSFIAASLALYLMGFSTSASTKTGIICAFASTLVEAISNHGLDNFTMQVTASGMAHLLLAEEL